MEIALDRTSAQPVYRQIAEHLHAEIAAGRLARGARLPTIRALAQRLGVNRDTVALAYDQLAEIGSVTSTVGRGTFVAERTPRPGFEPILAQTAERLLEFERSRPHYGKATPAIAMQELVPDPAFYPVEEFRDALAAVLARDGAELLRYGEPEGHRGLRKVVADRLTERGTNTARDDLVLTHGASQGISMAIRIFAEPGDEIAVEEPTYANVIASCLALGLRPVPVPMTSRGADLEVLARVLTRPQVRLFYTIPTFHNPMGTTTDLAHRRAVLELAAASAKPVIEDAYEMDLRFRGEPVPNLAALDTQGAVVQLFSFSKSLFPGARVGAIRARGRSREALLALRSASDLGGAPVLQAALEEFVRAGAYDRHLCRVRKALRSRFEVAFASLNREMPPGVSWTEPEGGYQIWVTLPRGLDSRELFADAARHGLLFAPGDQFFFPSRAVSALRLTLARTDEAEIRAGISRLGHAIARAREARPPRTQFQL